MLKPFALRYSLALLLLAPALAGAAELYRYVDDKGVTVLDRQGVPLVVARDRDGLLAAGVERGVEGAVGVQPDDRDLAAGLGVDGAGDDDLLVGLDRDGVGDVVLGPADVERDRHLPVDPERGVRGAVGVQTGDGEVVVPVRPGGRPGDHDLAVPLDGRPADDGPSAHGRGQTKTDAQPFDLSGPSEIRFLGAEPHAQALRRENSLPARNSVRDG